MIAAAGCKFFELQSPDHHGRGLCSQFLSNSGALWFLRVVNRNAPRSRTILLALLALVPLSVATLAQDEAPEADANDPRFLNQRGTAHFFAGRIEESLAHWDRVVKLLPKQAPHHWRCPSGGIELGRWVVGNWPVFGNLL